MLFNGKRGAPGDNEMIAKAPRLQSDGTPQEMWTCPGCGNENYPNRLFCNMRRCQQAKPGLTFKELKRSEHRPASPAMTNGSANGLPGPPAWTCPACGNQNYPGRWQCNSKKCSIPYPGTPHSGMDDLGTPLSGMMEASMMGFAGYGNGLAGLDSVPTYKPKTKKARTPPDGSWVCISCKNVNFPSRDHCNSKGCNLPRNVADGGPPEPKQPKVQEEPPPMGAWTCLSCGNVNWPNRTVCNRKSCSMPKPI
mmetsp:Transcript_71219/g.123664  ORF Transcript_71219/g.123664 Transcript_71219/m.123664 type:complete len:251 (+) Transcript_71219:37-789(+)